MREYVPLSAEQLRVLVRLERAGDALGARDLGCAPGSTTLASLVRCNLAERAVSNSGRHGYRITKEGRRMVRAHRE